MYQKEQHKCFSKTHHKLVIDQNDRHNLEFTFMEIRYGTKFRTFWADIGTDWNLGFRAPTWPHPSPRKFCHICVQACADRWPWDFRWESYIFRSCYKPFVQQQTRYSVCSSFGKNQYSFRIQQTRFRKPGMSFSEGSKLATRWKIEIQLPFEIQYLFFETHQN